MVISRKESKTDNTPTAQFEVNSMEEIKGSSGAEGVEGEENSVTRLAQQRGFDKCPICLTLVIADSVVTEKHRPRGGDLEENTDNRRKDNEQGACQRGYQEVE